MNDFVTAGPDIRDTLTRAAGHLRSISGSPRLDAEVLLAQALDVPRSYLLAHPGDRPDSAALARFERALERRGRGIPLAYIVGEREFWSLSFKVTPDTLVPRPETELLVEIALQLTADRPTASIADLGTGCGAIALSIASERPRTHIVATDVSEAALVVAQENARRFGIGNVDFRRGRWAEPLTGQRFDLVVSNPPYIRTEDPALADLKHEPMAALVSGPDGLDDIRRLAAECRSLLKPAGALLIEHGADQQADVARLLRAERWTDVACHPDLAGRPRVTQARRT